MSRPESRRLSQDLAPRLGSLLAAIADLDLVINEVWPKFLSGNARRVLGIT
jgi:hypothetical protein